ncbi:MAG TPA: peroxiredoxin [Galbitalea sp.]|jgi:peroxiredoxin|nr:peroxiredoxin [Galbitalea sp.]
MSDYTNLPTGLPVPEDDGAADHLRGMRTPDLVLPATSGIDVNLAGIEGAAIVYVYPMTGVPGVPLPEGWDLIPGARGCTPEACGFRDHFAGLRAAGATAVFGLSSQTTDYQSEAVERLHLPFAMLSDPELKLAEALSLPTFEVEGMRLYKRLTLIVRNGIIEHVFYPVFPTDTHAAAVETWLAVH